MSSFCLAAFQAGSCGASAVNRMRRSHRSAEVLVAVEVLRGRGSGRCGSRTRQELHHYSSGAGRRAPLGVELVH